MAVTTSVGHVQQEVTIDPEYYCLKGIIAKHRLSDFSQNELPRLNMHVQAFLSICWLMCSIFMEYFHLIYERHSCNLWI